MVSFSKLLVAAASVAGVLAAPAELVSRQTLTASATGNHGGYYYSFWTDGGGSIRFTLESGGAYSVTWSGNNGNWVGGKGWQPGTTNRVIQYSGTYSPNGNSYLAIYGWTRNPLIEYYVIESFGTWDPSSGMTAVGSMTAEGSSYRLGHSTRTQQPSIDGTQTFKQYWAVRSSKRVGGTCDMGAFFRAWQNANLPIGNHDYQIVATEGYFSSGSARIVVGSGGTTNPPTTSQPPTQTSQPPTTSQPPAGGSCSARWGQCGGQGWNGATCCQSGSTCSQQNQWYSQCL